MKDNNYLRRLAEKMDDTTSVTFLQKYVDEMVNIRGFADETPQDCLLLLTEELGELAKEVRKSHTHIKNDTAKNNAENLSGEIGDVFMMLLALCRTLDISLIDAFKTKELINCGRNWK